MTMTLPIPRNRDNHVRLSILVAIDPTQSSAKDWGHQLAEFEATLISVLENRPSDAEILVCHDGSYEDPFDLCAEGVRFCVPTESADEPSLIDLWQAGLAEASGRHIHLIGGGAKVTAGWSDSAQLAFESDRCGIVAGHCSTDLEQPNEEVLAGIMPGSGGGLRFADVAESRLAMPLLQGSFWRRELLVSVLEQLETTNEASLSLVASQLAVDAGWKIRFVNDCSI
ncbi:MAG: hypothetical protein AAF664_16430, partial [Planctomycetota bacterium]